MLIKVEDLISNKKFKLEVKEGSVSLKDLRVGIPDSVNLECKDEDNSDYLIW